MKLKRGDIVQDFIGFGRRFGKVHHVEWDKVWGFWDEDLQKVENFKFTEKNSKPFFKGGKLKWCEIGEVELISRSKKRSKKETKC